MKISVPEIEQFDAPGSLGRQLSRFEDNMAETFQAFASVMAIKLQPTNRKTLTYAAKLGELVMVDTSAGDVPATMPVATPANAGQMIGFVKLSASNVINLSVIDGSDTLNGGPTQPVGGASIGLTLFISSGEGWYSA